MKPPNVVKRIATALVVLPIAVGFTWFGGWIFAIGLAAVGALAQYELYDLCKKAGMQPMRVAGLAIGTYLMLLPLLPDPAAHPALLMVISAVILAGIPFLRSRRPLHALGATVLGIAYPILPLSALGYIRAGVWTDMGDLQVFSVTLLVLAMIWIADSAAYFSGSMLGKHLLFPTLSPKKTWEGYAGGAAAAIGAAFLFILFVDIGIRWPYVLGIAVVCGALSPLGDLAESALKRAVDAKDSGNIFPGHGGMLDRIDTVIISAPFVFAILQFI